MASPIAAIRNSRNEEDRTFSRLLSGISEDGRATQDMNSTPPSSSDWKTSIPARNSTERYPKMLTSLSNMEVYRNSIVVVPWVERAFRPALRLPKHKSQLQPLRSSTSAAEAIFLTALNAGLKARTTRASGDSNPRPL